MIYLDNNATTRIREEVLAEMRPFLEEEYGNPSAGYRLGKRARAAVEVARARVASLVGAREEEILFTSGGTESDNAAIWSALETGGKNRRHLVTSAAEHSAIENCCRGLEDEGIETTRVDIDGEGLLDPADLEAAIRPSETALVSLIWANNETGVLAPMAEAAEICSRAGVLFHSDAVQALGKVEISVADAGIHMLSISGHKFHGPKGVGALFLDRRVRFAPTIVGGGQESGRRSGTENVPGIVGLGKASELLAAEVAGGVRAGRLQALRDRFESEILGRVAGSARNGHPDRRLANTSNIYFEGVDAEGLLLLLDESGLCCSPGSACSTGKLEPSRVILAMGYSQARARSSVRFSFSIFNTEAEVEASVEILCNAIEKLRLARPPGGGPVVSAGR